MQKRGPWKPQATLNPYNGWVVARLMRAKGDGSGPIAEWIIDQWINEHADFLADRFNIRAEQFPNEFEAVREQFERQEQRPGRTDAARRPRGVRRPRIVPRTS